MCIYVYFNGFIGKYVYIVYRYLKALRSLLRSVNEFRLHSFTSVYKCLLRDGIFRLFVNECKQL